MKTILLSMVMLWISMCNKETDSQIISGTYEGTFQRGDGAVSEVSFTYSGNNWSGTSAQPKYPALCHGTYKVNGDLIHFENNCAFTADFDWTLILKGDYRITLLTDTRLEFERDYSTYKDVYKLTKK